jgi:hypothetical protein
MLHGGERLTLRTVDREQVESLEMWCRTSAGPIVWKLKKYLLTYLLTHLTYLHTYLLTLWSTVLLEKLIGSQLVKQFPALNGTRMFIAAFTSARHLSLF